MVQPLKFVDRKLISSHTFRGMWLLILAGVKSMLAEGAPALNIVYIQSVVLDVLFKFILKSTKICKSTARLNRSVYTLKHVFNILTLSINALLIGMIFINIFCVHKSVMCWSSKYSGLEYGIISIAACGLLQPSRPIMITVIRPAHICTLKPK